MKRKKTRIQGFMTVKEAAAYLGVNPITLKRWEKKGKLTARRHPMNNYRIFTKEEIENIKTMIEEGGEE
ncbi:MAG: helix-turn-helix domain-containing protein [Candidatus Zixiibacteriota bacterium]